MMQLNRVIAFKRININQLKVTRLGSRETSGMSEPFSRNVTAQIHPNTENCNYAKNRRIYNRKNGENPLSMSQTGVCSIATIDCTEILAQAPKQPNRIIVL